MNALDFGAHHSGDAQPPDQARADCVSGETEHKLGGTASSYGVSNAGTVFKLDKSGTFTVLYSFTGGNDGYSPSGHLASDGAGNLYGTTFLRGAYGFGTVFKMDETTGQITTLYSFQGGADGRYPANGVIRDRAGNLYGTTDYGGTFDAGTIFKITP